MKDQEPSKPSRDYHLKIVSNGAIMIRELKGDEIPKSPPFLGEEGFEIKNTTSLVSPGLLAYKIEQTVRGLQFIDPMENVSAGNQEKNEILGNTIIKETGL